MKTRIVLGVTINMLLVVFLGFELLAQAQQPRTAENRSTSEAKLQPLNIKPGLWESTRTLTTEGQMPIPTSMLERMTPEQRAKMQARMNADAARHGRTTTEKSCVTQEQIEHQKTDFGGNRECVTTITESTSSSARAKISCEAEGMHGTGTYEIKALDSEHIQGSSHAVMSGNGQTMNVDSTFTSKWLGSSCPK